VQRSCTEAAGSTLVWGVLAGSRVGARLPASTPTKLSGGVPAGSIALSRSAASLDRRPNRTQRVEVNSR
jgi:hypothetical protein